MKHNLKNQSGFTLIELAIVVVIIGILLSTIAPNLIGSTASAKALSKWKLATAIKDCGQKIHAELGLGTEILNNPAYETGNDLIDVCIADQKVTVASVKARMKLANSSNLKEQLTVVTEPAAGTKGVYKKDNSIVSLDATQVPDNIRIVFSNVSTAEIEELAVKYDNESSFDKNTADTNGQVQYTSVSGGLHTLTIQIPFKV